jgi:hypothetical protein
MLTAHINGNDGPLVNTATVAAPSGVTDPTPGNNSATDTDTVNDLAPTVSADNATVTVNEGDTAANTGSFSDYDDNVTITASVGTITQDTNTTSGNWSWIYKPSTNQTVTITATNADGTISTTSFNVVVNNVAPTITLSTSTITLSEGDGFSRSGSVSDPGTDLPATASVNYGDGTVGTVALTGSSHSFTLNHTYGDESTGSGYQVTVTVTDTNGGSSSQSFYAVVNNVAPTVVAVPNQAVNSGTLLTLNPIATFSDPVFAGSPTFSYSINWGDGSSPDSGTGSSVTVGSPGVLTTGSVNDSHTYTIGGKKSSVFTVTVTVTDDDGASGTGSFTVTVVKPELVVGGPVTVNPSTVVLSQYQLKPIVAAAINEWRAAGVSPAALKKLSHTPVQIVDLNGGLVGGTFSGGILIDPTAAGHGWFVDPTPYNNSEFIGGAHGSAKGRIDLLTVVAHEMGNVLGLPETDGHDVMGKWLAPGERRLPMAKTSTVKVVSLSRSGLDRTVSLLGAMTDLVPDDLAAELAQLSPNKAGKLRRS